MQAHGTIAQRGGKLGCRLELRLLLGGFIRANPHARLAIVGQSVVASGQLQLLSVMKVNEADTKRLGTVTATEGMIARLAYVRARPWHRAGFSIEEVGPVRATDHGTRRSIRLCRNSDAGWQK
jgi:hypothetical protein